jgi:hypothetical protein
VESKAAREGTSRDKARSNQVTHVVLLEELFERIPGRSEEIDVATLTPELEYRLVTLPEFGRRDNRDLVIPLNPLGEEDEFGRCDQPRQFRVWRDMQVRLDRDVVLQNETQLGFTMGTTRVRES